MLRRIGTFSKNYYSVLGLQTGANTQEIRQAYLTLAKKHHPDSATGNTEKFKQVAEAYEALSDDRIREEYEKVQARPQKEHYHHRPNQTYEWGANKTRPDNSPGFEYWGKTYGYEYHDPYMSSSTRYTYSKYKQDRFRQTARSYSRSSSPYEKEKEKKDDSGASVPVLIGFCSVGLYFSVKS